MQIRAAPFALALLAVSCASSTNANTELPPKAGRQPEGHVTAAEPSKPTASRDASAESARDTCRKVMVQTRECGDLYVPALLRTRARFDRPPGIAARYKAEGEEKLLPVARDEFKNDWSDRGIEAHCDKLIQMPQAKRDEVVAREQSCLPAGGDCAKFVACNMALLERRWSTNPKSGR